MHQVAVATITWARSEEEETLLRRSLELLAGSGLPVAVADTGASPTFAAFLDRLPGVSVITTAGQGLVGQIQASLIRAATFGKPFLLYAEADKELFFERGVHEFLRRAPAGSDIGVVVASRSDDSFRTFPPTQRYTEGVINQLCGELTGTAGDYSYGPFVMNACLLPHVTRLEHRLGWGWRHFMFLTAHHQGLQVVHIRGDYPCPVAQRVEGAAERGHRLRQLSQNILGLVE